jgi:hypothetical protein
MKRRLLEETREEAAIRKQNEEEARLRMHLTKTITLRVPHALVIWLDCRAKSDAILAGRPWQRTKRATTSAKAREILMRAMLDDEKRT